MRKGYPSDISREQFESIIKELVGAKKRTHPRKYDLYDLLSRFCNCYKKDVPGGPFLMVFPNGKMCATIMTYGQAQMKMESVFLTESCVSWWKQSGPKTNVWRRQLC